jgi:thymidylate synthase ThyX
MISKLLSHPLAELQETGERMKTEAQKVIPTLIKYARTNAYWQETPPVLRELAAELLSGSASPAPARSGEIRLVQGPDEPEARLAAAILYEHSDLPYAAVWRQVRNLTVEQHQRVIREYDARRRMHGDAVHGYKDPPLRALEHLTFTFEILVDYGAYRDIQRHRMATQTTQPLTCAHGYDVPELMVRCGFESPFHTAMEQASTAFSRLTQDHPDEAQYVVPLAYRKRVLFTWNLRELHHFISLRSARQGHISYRRVAQAAYRELEREYPFLAQFVRVDLADYEMARPG